MRTIITAQDLSKVFTHWESGSTIKVEARRLHVGEGRLLAMLRLADPLRCERIKHKRYVKNATKASHARKRTEQTPTPAKVTPPRFAKRKHAMGFVDTRQRERVSAEQREVLQSLIAQRRIRTLAQMSAEEVAALHARAEVVLNGHVGLIIGPVYPTFIVSE